MAPNLLPKENRSAVECIESFDWIEVTQEVLVADAWVRPLSSWRRLLFFSSFSLPPGAVTDPLPLSPGGRRAHARPDGVERLGRPASLRRTVAERGSPLNQVPRLPGYPRL